MKLSVILILFFFVSAYSAEIDLFRTSTFWAQRFLDGELNIDDKGTIDRNGCRLAWEERSAAIKTTPEGMALTASMKRVSSLHRDFEDSLEILKRAEDKWNEHNLNLEYFDHESYRTHAEEAAKKLDEASQKVEESWEAYKRAIQEMRKARSNFQGIFLEQAKTL